MVCSYSRVTYHVILLAAFHLHVNQHYELTYSSVVMLYAYGPSGPFSSDHNLF